MNTRDPRRINLARLQASRARDPHAEEIRVNAQTRRVAMEREDQRRRQKALRLTLPARPWWTPLRRLLPI